jgi:hypothetical protein
MRLVDVLGPNGTVIHTYPITLAASDNDADDGKYEAKALEAAAHGQLVPDAELKSLTARMHVSRRGQMAPFGDNLAGNSETKVGLEQLVRERAYRLWEQEGRPEGRTGEYWHRALDQHLRERAYVLWQQEGSPDGLADEYWRRIIDFEAQWSCTPRRQRGTQCWFSQPLACFEIEGDQAIIEQKMDVRAQHRGPCKDDRSAALHTARSAPLAGNSLTPQFETAERSLYAAMRSARRSPCPGPTVTARMAVCLAFWKWRITIGTGHWSTMFPVGADPCYPARCVAYPNPDGVAPAAFCRPVWFCVD